MQPMSKSIANSVANSQSNLSFAHRSTVSLSPNQDAMHTLLNDPVMSKAFHEKLRAQHSPENSDFFQMYKEIEGRLGDYNSKTMDVKVRWIMSEFVVDGGGRQLNLPEPMMTRLVRLLVKSDPLAFDVLREVKDEVVGIFYLNNYASFMRDYVPEKEQAQETSVKKSFTQRFFDRFKIRK